MSRCLLPMLSSEGLAGLPGLAVGRDGEIGLDKKIFTCCGGTGLREDLAAGVTEACGLLKRLNVVKDLAVELGDPLLPELKRGIGPGAFKQRIAEIAAKRSTKGLFGRVDDARSGPSVWAMATFAAWRFGLLPHVVLIGRTAPSKILPAPGKKPPDVLFVGGVDRLWEAPEADALEALVNYAYARMTPLFGELVVRKGAEAQKGAGTRAAFDRKLKGISARPPLAWIAEASLAKLPAVADGLKDEIEAVARFKKKQGPQAPKMPELPW